VFEREQAKERLKELGFIAGSKVEGNRPAFLFATSAGEVGVDLDADHMVCDLVAWERMVQRLGRVNRRGNGESRVVVLIEPEPQPNKKEREALDKQTGDKKLEEREQKQIEAFEAKVRTWRNIQAPLKMLPKNYEDLNASPGALRDPQEARGDRPKAHGNSGCGDHSNSAATGAISGASRRLVDDLAQGTHWPSSDQAVATGLD